jgi:hypothetical protein
MPRSTPSPAVILAAIVAVVAVLAAGLWLAAGVIAPTYLTSIVFGVVWFVIASVLLGQFTKRRPQLKWPVRGTFIATAVVASAAFAWTSLRDETVDEQVVTGVPITTAAGPPIAADDAAAKKEKPKQEPRNIALVDGDFQPADEGSAAGTATVVAPAAGGRVLTLTDFEVNNGPDLRVYLVPGDGTDTSDNVDLGGLKGNKGNQQYDVPRGVDLGRYRTVVIWCRSFSVAFARAKLSGV